MQKERLQELDALRGLAAMAVVIFHYTTRYDELYGHPFEFPFEWLNYGRYGVQLFFIISGFVIFLTLDRTRYASDFIISRFSRLFPAYWFGVIFSFLAISLFTTQIAHRGEIDFTTALVNLTMLQNWLGFGSVEPVYWTLFVELSFYFVMFILYSLKLLKHINIIATVWLLLIASFYFLKTTFDIPIPYSVKMLLILDYGHLFIAGIFFYKYKAERDNKYLFLLSLCLLVEYYMYYSESAIATTLFFGLFFLLTRGWLNFISVQPILTLGAISYSLYLIHESVGYIIINYLYSLGLSHPAILLIPIAFSVLVALMMNKYIEKKATPYIKNSLRNKMKKYRIGGSIYT